MKKVVQQRGFGFITVENGKDVFFHRSSAADFDSLEEGDSVEFDVEDSPKGERAANVKKV
ncbi:cold shock domain-containing protein [bacterium]|nr:cold shock domain-containing protein [bacterium]MCG2676052.1 cold shock domain-containing protein [bacterium]